MRNLCISLYALLCVGCATSNSDVTVAPEMCWSDIISFETRSNFNLVCIGSTYVTSLVFFANDGSDSTICRHAGTVTNVDPQMVLIRLDRGTCENGNFMRPSEVRCIRQGSHRLQCSDEDGFEFELGRELQSLYKPRSDVDIKSPLFEEAKRRLVDDFMSTMKVALEYYYTEQGLGPISVAAETDRVIDGLMECLLRKLEIAAIQNATSMRVLLENYAAHGRDVLYSYIARETLDNRAAGCIPATGSQARTPQAL